MRRKSSIRGFLEMSYQNAVLPKPGSEMRAAAAAMAREHEVRHRWQNLEAQFGKGMDQRFAARDDGIPSLKAALSGEAQC